MGAVAWPCASLVLLAFKLCQCAPHLAAHDLPDHERQALAMGHGVFPLGHSRLHTGGPMGSCSSNSMQSSSNIVFPTLLFSKGKFSCLTEYELMLCTGMVIWGRGAEGWGKVCGGRGREGPRRASSCEQLHYGIVLPVLRNGSKRVFHTSRPVDGRRAV